MNNQPCPMCNKHHDQHRPCFSPEPLPPVAGSAIGSASTDVIKSALPKKENHELAEDLLARFPGVDRAELLKDMVSICFYWMRWGNKREERAACDFLNELQRIAIRNAKTAYIFHRADGFYPLKLKDDADAKANAESNPGTLKVENAATGEVVWTPNE